MRTIEALEAPTDLRDIGPGKYDMPNHVYHSMNWTLSSSGARKILEVSPQRFWYDLNHPQPSSKALEDGTLWHAWMLEGGRGVEFVDAKNWLTKDSKEKRAEIRERGGIPALESDRAVLDGALRELMANPTIAEYLNPLEGEAEGSYFTVDEETGVMLRTRPDWLTWINGQLTIVDYKTTGDATERGFRQSVGKYGYHQQAAWYIDSLCEVYGVDDAKFVFIAQEKEPPYYCEAYTLNNIAILEGRDCNREAIDIFAYWQGKGWPEHSQGETELSLPTWAFKH